jgi:hypothetical protein
MAIWDDWFGQNPSTKPPTQAEVNSALLTNLYQMKQYDPAGYWLNFGNKTPEEAFAQSGGFPTENRELTAEERARYNAELTALQSQGTTPPPESTYTPPPPTEGGPPAYSGPTATQQLQSIFPAGFEQSYIPTGFGSSNIESRLGTARGSAQQLIDTMLKRGTVTPTGATSAAASLGSQDPAIRERLANIANLITAGGQANLRGIANQAFSEVAPLSGEGFDVTPYRGRVESAAQQFAQSFPGEFASRAGGVDYDVAGIGAAGGAPTGEQTLPGYDPYAVEGGKLSTGIEGGATGSRKKRTTSVF